MTPAATYRLQFRDGMTFDRAAVLAPYLRRLGVSHLYASPVFAAVGGSTHGYDVIDPNRFDPALGGTEGFERMAAALRAQGLGLVLDIVPNHMAASVENPWWRSVLEWGDRSPYARHFDVDWSEQLTLPVLGRSFDEVLAAGELSLAVDRGHGTLALAYFDNRFPLAPESYAMALAPIDHPAARSLEAAARAADPARPDSFHAAARALFNEQRTTILFEERLLLQSRDHRLLARLHEVQPWRLGFWQDAREHLSYRRFFEITGLVGVRVEDPAVFADCHRLVLDLVRRGVVDGLRIDHVDGLADPEGYLARLRREVGPDVYVVVEKILGPAERLPPAWPVAGTTGYEFIAAVAAALADPAGVDALRESYAAIAPGEPEPDADLRDAKRLILTRNFAGELATLVRLAGDCAGPDVDPDRLKHALVELILGFDVYRTYGTGRFAEADRAVIGRAGAAALRQGVQPGALDALTSALEGETAAALSLRTRFQQLTGPVMAKAMEDTFFYRYHAALALNEVGGEATGGAYSADRFHRAMAERRETQPHGLSATATHDTKRGEDARARLYALTEAPDRWIEAISRWRQRRAADVAATAGGPAPEPAVEMLIYQSLLGAWEGPERAADLLPRMSAFVEKALREAKRRTDWFAPDPDYEAAVQAYLRALLADRAFLADFDEIAAPFLRAGTINALAQTMLKLVAPGVPDVYQGSESRDLSLVDPDNRRQPDFRRLADALDEGAADGVERLEDGRAKQAVIARCLALRRRRPILFSDGEYRPLAISGTKAANALAFARRHGEEWAIAILPRLVLQLIDHRTGLIPAASWGDTAVALPDEIRGAATDVLTDITVPLSGALPLAQALARAPVCCLVSAAAPNA